MRSSPYPVLAITFVVSIIVMLMAAGNGSTLSFAIAGIAFAATAGLAAVRLQPSSQAPSNADMARLAIERSSVLVAIVYAWGALALFVVYPLSGLTWRHSWQYGLGMLLTAVGLAIYVAMARRPDSALASARALDGAAAAAALHCVGVAAAIAYIISSGKLDSPKGDWAAHWIFIAGGVAVLVIGSLEVLTHLRLRRA